MDGSETEVELIDLTLDDDLDLEETLPTKDEHSDDDADSHDRSRRRGSCDGGDEPAEDDDDIYSLETLPASLSRADTVLGHRGAAGSKMSRLSEERQQEEEDEDDEAAASTGNGTRAGNDDVALPAEAASCPSPSKAAAGRDCRGGGDAEPSVGADVPGDEPLFPWIEPFHVSRTFQCDTGQVTVRKIPGDGHCLYRACLHQRDGRRRALPSDADVERLRANVADYMRSHRDAIGVFFPDVNSLDASITTVEEGGWGDAVSLSVIANLWRRPIDVYMEMGSVIRHQPEGLERPEGPGGPDGEAPDAEDVLRVAYRCVEEDDGTYVYNHFDSVEDVVLDGHCSQATTVPVTRSRSPSPAGSPPRSPPRCSPPPRTWPESPGASASPRRQPAVAKRKTPLQRGSPSGSAKRPRDRGGANPPATAPPAATSTPSAAADSAYRSNSQDLVDPASPSPALSPPGCPDDECVSASQETLKAQHAKEARRARRRARRASLSLSSSGSDPGRARTRLAPLLPGKDPTLTALAELFPDATLDAVLEAGDLVGDTATATLDLDHLPEPELDSVQKTSDWVSKVWDLDVDTVVAAFASSPEVTQDISENVAEDTVEDEDLPADPLRREVKVCDVGTCISSVEVCGTIVRSYSEVTTAKSRLVTRNVNKNSRTISTNVHLRNGRLIGTFQVLY